MAFASKALDKTLVASPERQREADTDWNVVQRVQAGEVSAFDQLILKYRERVFAVVYNMTSNREDAADLVQEAFIKAFQSINRFQGQSSFFTWLYRIAVNTARNTMASRQRRPLDYEADLSESEQSVVESRMRHGDTPEAVALTDEIHRTVNDAIGALPEDLRTAIVLREVEGLSYEEIAEAMDCPVGTVRSRIFRAREAIDRSLKPLLD